MSNSKSTFGSTCCIVDTFLILIVGLGTFRNLLSSFILQRINLKLALAGIIESQCLMHDLSTLIADLIFTWGVYLLEHNARTFCRLCWSTATPDLPQLHQMYWCQVLRVPWTVYGMVGTTHLESHLVLLRYLPGYPKSNTVFIRTEAPGAKAKFYTCASFQEIKGPIYYWCCIW